MPLHHGHLLSVAILLYIVAHDVAILLYIVAHDVGHMYLTSPVLAENENSSILIVKVQAFPIFKKATFFIGEKAKL